MWPLHRTSGTTEVGRDRRQSLAQPSAQRGSAVRSDRLLRALSGVLTTSREGDCITSLGNVFHCFTVLLVKKLFLILKSAPPVFSFMPVASHLPIEEPAFIFSVTST